MSGAVVSEGRLSKHQEEGKIPEDERTDEEEVVVIDETDKGAGRTSTSTKHKAGSSTAYSTVATKDVLADGEVDPSKLWYIHGQAYDLEKEGWLEKHPGGSYSLLLCRGMDVTALFESYHPFTDRNDVRLASFKPVQLPEAVLRKYVVDRKEGNWFRLPDGSPDPFWAAIKERCAKLQKEKQIPRLMSRTCLAFHIFLLLCQPVAWYFGYINSNFYIALGTAFLMGTTTWIAGRLGHDAGHYQIFQPKAWFKQQLVGMWAGLGLSNVGYWELLHTIMHHTDTNSDDNDPDLYHYMYALRDTPGEKWNMLHRLQGSKLWCYGIWSLTTVGLLIIEPILLLLTGAGTFPATPFSRVVMRPLQWFKLVAHLIAFPTFMLSAPIFINWYTLENKGILIGLRFLIFWVYLTTSGFWFGLFSQVNHFAEGCVDASKKNSGWAQRQVETAANFSVNSLFWSIMTAGINIQIEHHLFPGVASDRLDAYVPVVKQTCKDFGVDYKEFPSFWSCLASVHRYMDRLAKPVYEPTVATPLAVDPAARATK